jgi:hypothetical protein
LLLQKKEKTTKINVIAKDIGVSQIKISKISPVAYDVSTKYAKE